MPQFNDSHNRTWTLSLHVGLLRQIKRELEVDLLDLGHGQVLDQLASDPALLVDVLYLIAKPQVEKAGLTDVQFGEAMTGDALDAASEALLDAIMEFLPAKKRGLLRKLTAKVKDAEEAMMSRLETEIDALDLSELMGGPGEQSSPSPASAASTPAP